MDQDQIQQVRNFNRAVTQRIGVLSDDYLGRGRPLGESRLLFEIGRRGADLRDLRARLSLDSGYLSRMLRSLEAQGLVDSQRAAADGRVRRAVLTRKGLREFEALDRRSQDFATSLLTSLGATQRERMVAAMAEVERLMRASAVTVELADPDSPRPMPALRRISANCRNASITDSTPHAPCRPIRKNWCRPQACS